MDILRSFCILGFSALLADAFFCERSMTTVRPSTLKDDSLFGFSISYQSQLQRLIVSAPRADFLGQIYTINVTNPEPTPENFKQFNISKPHGEQNSYWLGATVKASSNYYVTCAPRYGQKFKNPYAKGDFVSTVGACFLVSNGIRGLKPIRSEDRGLSKSIRENLADSFGWSIEISPDEEDFLIGGAAMARGRVSYYQNAHDPKIESKTPTLVQVTNPKEGFNFGYSIESGNFFTGNPIYAISTPYGDMGRGKVYFIDSKRNKLGEIIDNEVGTMFGAALCAATLMDQALLVGAPAYTDNAFGYDIGAVYIYIAETGSTQMTRKRIIKGFSIGGLFGFSIANLNDMDGDRMDEIAIAAPYDDDGKGAVYIYSGAGILQGNSPRQKINREAFMSFGFSLEVLQDYDNTGCNKLAIGAIESNSIFLLKCLASITVVLDSFITKSEDQKEVEINACVGVEYPEYPKSIAAVLIVKVKILEQRSRILTTPVSNNLYIYEETIDSSSRTGEKVASFCRPIKATNPTDTAEDSPPVKYLITASLKDNPEESDVYEPSKVLLSERSTLSITREWGNECGKIGCKPNINQKIDISSISQPYIIGSSNSIKFSLSMYNTGDTAYKSCVVVHVLGARFLISSPGCTLGSNAGTMSCEPRDPIHTNQPWNINDIKLETKDLTSAVSMLTITSTLFNRCDNKTDYHQEKEVIALQADTNNISIKGRSNPEKVVQITQDDMLENGKEFEHLYTISNNGLTNWVGVKIKITMKYEPFIEFSDSPIKVYTGMSNIMCSIDNKTITNNEITAPCTIGDLWRFQTTTVVISMKLVPNTLELNENKPNVTITTTLRVLKIEQSFSVSTVLELQVATVPLWIIITSSIVGLIIFAAITFALYRFGFLKRKNKEKLVELKKEVHRQSIRRSMIRDSMRAAMRREASDLEILPHAEHSTKDRRMTIDEQLQCQT